MPKPPVAALIGPQVKIVDVITRDFRNEIPEEYIRQEISKSHPQDYLYSGKRLKLSPPSSSARPAGGLTSPSSPEGQPHKKETIWALIERMARGTASGLCAGVGAQKRQRRLKVKSRVDKLLAQVRDKYPQHLQVQQNR